MTNIRSLQVVVVDDNDLASELLCEVVEMLGHEVRVAATGGQALALCAEHVPNVLIVDIILPDIDGYALAEQLRQHYGSSVVILALSGLPKSMQNNPDGLFDAWMEKPVDLDTLEGYLSSASRRYLSDAA